MNRATILWSAIILVASITTCLAGDANGVNVTVTADAFSKYVWRGQTLNDEAVLQPSVSAGLQGFTGTVWTNLDLTDENGHSGECTEVDLSLDYTRTLPGLDALSVSAGAVHYRFPHTSFNPTTEIYAGLGLGCTCGGKGTCPGCLLSPSAWLYWDIDEIEGTYVQLGIGRTIEKLVPITETYACDCVVGASLGWGGASYNEGYFGVDKSALNDLTVTVALPVAIGKWTVKPSVGFATLLDDEIRQATAHNDNMWVGVSASYALGN